MHVLPAAALLRMARLPRCCGISEADNGCDARTGAGAGNAGGAAVPVQSLGPSARVVYVSATGGSELGHIGLMERLGLWGPGTAFGNVREFVVQCSSRGVGAMEMVAMDMKARGIFMSRTLSFAGSNFDVVDYELPPQAANKYDGIVA